MDKILHLISQKIAGVHSSPLLIAVGGAGGCGKSQFSKELAKYLNTTAILELDHYKTPRVERYPQRIFGADPRANNCELLVSHLKALKDNMSIETPVYCSTLGRADQSVHFNPQNIIIVDGEISTYEQFRHLMDITIYIDSGLITQLRTRLRRDIKVRGYTVKKAVETFIYSNLKEFRKFGLPTKKYADIVLRCNRNYKLSVIS